MLCDLFEAKNGMLDYLYVFDVVFMESGVNDGERSNWTLVGLRPSHLQPGKRENVLDEAGCFWEGRVYANNVLFSSRSQLPIDDDLCKCIKRFYDDKRKDFQTYPRLY